MAKLMIFILVVTSLIMVHAEPNESGSSSSSSMSIGRAQQDQGNNFLMANSDNSNNINNNNNNQARDFATKHEYDDDLERLNDGSTRYDILIPNGSNEDESMDDELMRTKQQTTSSVSNKNLARLLHGMPQFNRFFVRYQPEKRAINLRHLVTDKDDKEFGGLNSLTARIHEEPLARSTERLVQRLRDQLQKSNPRTFREKRRRCQFDPNLGIKNPSSCDTDSYFGAADYTMRNVWDSAGRR